MQNDALLNLDPVFSSFEEAIIVLDKTRRIIYLNAKAEQWFGNNPSTLNSHSISKWTNAITKQVALFNLVDHSLKSTNSKPIGEILLELHDS